MGASESNSFTFWKSQLFKVGTTSRLLQVCQELNWVYLIKYINITRRSVGIDVGASPGIALKRFSLGCML